MGCLSRKEHGEDMPLSHYYAGKGPKVMKKMKEEYGAEKGERVFYATANKRKAMRQGARKPGQKRDRD